MVPHLAAAQKYGAHAVVPSLRHAPRPLHSCALVSTVVLAQLATVHSLSGSVPFAIAAHVPSAPEPFFTAVHA
ncbi:MAG: hypothetical protein HYV09_07525 [Deltaproteobacteria bacterium]|nr:hypothetical protein [Deltaproteobacteria bacterium]